MKSLIRLVLASALFSVVAVYASNQENRSPVQVITSENMQQLGKLSAQKRLPILLIFSASHCPYCDLLEEEIIKPMLISGDYTNKVIIRKLVTDETDEIRDFNGKRISVNDFIAKHNVYVTPTMLFFGPDGKELTQRMIGINTVEMYGGLVDNAIDESIAELRKALPKLAQKTSLQP
jgi:thioredoxin-related protein